MPSFHRIPLLVLISAPSGAGKTTLCQNLMSKHPEFTRVITCTTRPPVGVFILTVILLHASNFI